MSDARDRQVYLYRAILLAAGLVVLGLLFRELITLLMAVLMTVILAIGLSAGADRFERRGVPRPVAVLITLQALLAAIALILALVIPTFVDEIQQFVDDVPGIVNEFRDVVHDVTGADTQEIGDGVQDFLQRYVDEPQRLIGPITSIGLGVAGVLGALILMVMTAVFMAVNPRPLLDGALSLVPPERRDDARRVMERLRESWIGWMQGLAVDMLLTGLLLYIGLSLIGLDFALVFAVLSALLTVVPYFGAIVSGAFPVLFALTDGPGKALLVLLIYVAVQQFEGNVTVPLVMARTVKLHPAMIAIGVVVVGQLFGAVGLIVAVPLLSGIVILVDEVYVKPMEAAYAERRHDGIELPGEPELAPAPPVEERRGVAQ